MYKKHTRLKVFLVSLATLLLFILVLIALSKCSSPPAKKQNAYSPPLVQTATYDKGSHPVTVTAYGTARPTTTLTLHAPFAGSIKTFKKFHEGAYVYPGDTLFLLDRREIRRQGQKLKLKLYALGLEKRKLAAKSEAVSQSILHTHKLRDVLLEESSTLAEKHANDKELFSKAQTLRKKKALSEQAFLEAENRYKTSSLQWTQSKKSLEQNSLNLEQLLLEKENTLIEKKRLQQDLTKVKLDLSGVKELWEKADIQINTPCQILSLKVQGEEEVSPGQILATLRELEEVEIPVLIPDSYFPWLYQGSLLEKTLSPDVTISLVHPKFTKSFQGGIIKAFGAALNSSSRSLPVLIARKNPLSKNGLPIRKEELLPGMYCKVTLTLDKEANTLLIPPLALQEGNFLYALSDTSTLEKIPCTPLLETEQGLIVRPSSDKSSFTLIQHPLRQAFEGMTIRQTLKPGL